MTDQKQIPTTPIAPSEAVVGATPIANVPTEGIIDKINKSLARDKKKKVVKEKEKTGGCGCW